MRDISLEGELSSMFWALNENVYFVKGKKRSCLYDFNTSKLYSINDLLTQKIDLMNNGELCSDNVDDELKEVIEKLVEAGIVISSENPITHQIEEIRNMDKKISFVWIEITNKCNLKCCHCYNESDIHRDTNMSLNNYKMVIDEIIKLGVRKIQIIGGEPFLYPANLRAMLDYTVGKFDFIEIFTNGTLISQEWYEYLSKNSIHIALSVYSYEKKQHDKITGHKGSWDLTNKTIKQLNNCKIPYRVCNVLMKDLKLGQVSTDLYSLSEEKDIVRMSGRANFKLLSEELIRKKLITKKTFQKPIKKSFCSSVISRHNCFGSKLYIAADLSCYPCVMERRIKHCVIDNENGIVINGDICSLTKDKVNGCCDCEYRYACFDCRPNSLSGDIGEKPWFCTYNPLSGQWDDEEEFILNLKRQWSDSIL